MLRLVAMGSSDQAATDALGISIRTAQKHLEGYYRKLAVKDRSQARNWLGRRKKRLISQASSSQILLSSSETALRSGPRCERYAKAWTMRDLCVLPHIFRMPGQGRTIGSTTALRCA